MTTLAKHPSRRLFHPSIDSLEGRQLLSFGGGNIDPNIPRLSSHDSGLNFTSNTFHSINNSIPGVAESIIANRNNPNAVLRQLDSFASRVPYGKMNLVPILAADLQTFQRGSGTISTSDATDALTGLYNDLLGRAPDQTALDLGVPAIQNGATTAQVTTLLVSSPEYIGNHITDGASGFDNQTQYVTALYNDVLGRAPDPGGLNFFVNQIETRAMTLGQVASTIVNSPEAATSPSSVLIRDAFPTAPAPTYYFGSPAPDGTITGNFRGTSTAAQVQNLLQRDLITYLGNGIGTSFNILKSHRHFASDNLLTYNGRV